MVKLIIQARCRAYHGPWSPLRVRRRLKGRPLTFSLIGRNGIGKSTLLRNLALREVAIPTHITVLYVEQEIVGDDTTALDSVLQADVWRHKLITEEKELMARLDELEKTSATPQDGAAAADEGAEAEKDDITERLGDIQKKLVDMEAETGPSRASALLAGLGFDDADQKKPTRAFSGGWRMRLALARALFVKPDVSKISGQRLMKPATHAR